MAADQRKRQKKLQRRAAKRQEKKHQITRQQSLGIAGRLTAAARYPVLHSRVLGDIDSDKGMAQVLVSRALPNGLVAVAVFLVDPLCLGVKNAHAEILPRSDYDSKYVRKMQSEMDVRPVAPAFARKYVEDALAYALDLGFSPHPDYQKAKLIFGDIDVGECTEVFEFGKDGKPFFIAGPYDSPQRCEFIMNVLSRRLGPGEFDALLRLDGSEALRLEEDGDPEEFGDEDMDDLDEDE